MFSGQPSFILGNELLPLEMPLELSPFYTSDGRIADLWSDPWLDPLAADFS